MRGTGRSTSARRTAYVASGTRCCGAPRSSMATAAGKSLPFATTSAAGWSGSGTMRGAPTPGLSRVTTRRASARATQPWFIFATVPPASCSSSWKLSTFLETDGTWARRCGSGSSSGGAACSARAPASATAWPATPTPSSPSTTRSPPLGWTPPPRRRRRSGSAGRTILRFLPWDTRMSAARRTDRFLSLKGFRARCASCATSRCHSTPRFRSSSQRRHCAMRRISISTINRTKQRRRRWPHVHT
mmetsp:Transcript_25212/g.79106  ORF Transcript_25212/g.79106 Transcript_25212/m.79106 type:complete len:245 (+) Transcript_25212:729-1463(+)